MSRLGNVYEFLPGFAGRSSLTFGPVDDDELVRRFKAALAYAGLSVPQVAERITDEPNLSASTLYDVQQRRRNRSPLLSPGERAAVAQACGLPDAFFTIDFAQLNGQASVDSRLDAIEAQVRQLEEARGGPERPGELGRFGEEPQPSDERPRQEEPQTAADRRRGGGG